MKKIYENFEKSLEIFRKFWKSAVKSVFHRFYDFLDFRKIFGNLRESSEAFGNLRKFSEVIFRCFCDFLKISENRRKSSEVFGILRKFSENFGNGSKVKF